MVKLQSSAVLISLSVWITLCAVCQGFIELQTEADCKKLRGEIDFPIAMEMESESDDKQDNITFSMIGLPAHNIKDYDLKVKLQRLRGNNELPYASPKQQRNAIESMMKIRPELGKCWTLSGSLRNIDKAMIPPLSRNRHVLASLFCFNDILESVLINDINNSSQLKALRKFVKKCKASDGLLIEESIPTRNIGNITECYRVLPCAFCEQEVIEIRRGKTMVWNYVTEAVDEYCSMTQALIPATSVLECFLKDGRFIMNVQGPDKKLRCVSNNCEAAPAEKQPLMEVNYLKLRYNKCEEEEVKKAEPKEYGKPIGQLGMFEELQIKAHVKEHMKEVAKFESTTSDSQDNDIITSLNELLENFNQTTKL